MSVCYNQAGMATSVSIFQSLGCPNTIFLIHSWKTKVQKVVGVLLGRNMGHVIFLKDSSFWYSCFFNLLALIPFCKLHFDHVISYKKILNIFFTDILLLAPFLHSQGLSITNYRQNLESQIFRDFHGTWKWPSSTP